MHTARIPPVDPAPATIAAALAMHAGHICPSSELLNRVHGGHVQILMQVSNGQGVTSVAGFQREVVGSRRAGDKHERQNTDHDQD